MDGKVGSKESSDKKMEISPFIICIADFLFILFFSGEFIRDLVALESGGSGGVVWRIRANATKLVCAVGSRNGTEETKLLVLDFDVSDSNK